MAVKHLYKVVLNCLVHLNKQQDIQTQIFDYISKAGILFERELLNEALSELEKAEKLAIHYENDSLILLIRRTELKYLSMYDFTGMSEKQVVDKQMKINEIMRYTRSANLHTQLYDILKYRFTYKGCIRSDKQKENLNDLVLSELNLIANSSYKGFETEKLHLLFQSTYFLNSGNYKAAIRLYQDLILLFDENKHMILNPPLYYLNAILGVLDSLQSVGLYKEMPFFISRLKEMEKGDYSAVNPNDDVNCGQSTNDVIPTAGKMTSLRLLQNLKKELLRLHGALCKKAEEFDHVIKMGRTQMQDAVPIRLGQEFQAYSDAIMRDIHRMDNAMDEMRTVNMGGTAVGTGINADEAYVSRIVPNLSKISDIQFVQAFDLIDATQNLDPFVAVSGAVKACAVTLSKIANDLRLMSSGPRAGFGEINLPAKQNGSSIMPGKVNPVIPEVVNQVAFNIIGNDVTITMAAEGGQLELNAFEPIVFYCLFQSIDTLAYAVQTFIDNCVTGITANEERCRQLVENSIGVITAICPHVGYEKAAEIAKKAMKTGESIRNLILREGLLSEKEMETVLNPVNMTEPGISGKELLRK